MNIWIDALLIVAGGSIVAIPRLRRRRATPEALDDSALAMNVCRACMMNYAARGGNSDGAIVAHGVSEMRTPEGSILARFTVTVADGKRTVTVHQYKEDETLRQSLPGFVP